MPGSDRSLVARLAESPIGGAAGLFWPWVTPWAIGAARGSTPDGPTAPASRFRVLSANALGPNRRPARWAAAAAAVDADVIVVVEASKPILAALETAVPHDRYPWSFIERRRRWGGCGVWSRYPAELLDSGDAGYAYAAVAVDAPGGGRMTVVAVHTVAPTTPEASRRWVASFERLAHVVDGLPRPLVAAGDYNATLGHRPMRRFLERTGMTDAHTAVGRGLARTWPARRLPSIALIDRVLVTDDIRPIAVVEHRLPGSDHQAVVADLFLPPTPE